ncbi:MAG: response regulator [Planctomycetes bacterium]|nr:response regulator [Planctomycetota bacterium]
MKNKTTVLVVDDQEIGRQALEGLLFPMGFELAFAENGPQTLDKAKELHPDLILLDVMMPGMNGIEVCRKLRADPLSADVPIIMVTALDDRDSRLQAIEAGADDFITKPFDRTELRARVRTITRLNRYRRLLLERVKFEWAVERSGDGYLVLKDDGKILYANIRARLYLGLPENKKEDFSETFLELARNQYHLEPQQAWESWPKQSPAPLQPPRYLVRPESPSRNALWLQIEMLDFSSELNGEFIVRLHDVTTQMAMHRDIWKFHSMISHKLRTPLTAIIAGLEILSQQAENYPSAEIAEFAGIALKNAQDLQGEIDRILQYLNAPKLPDPGEGLDLALLPKIINTMCASLDIKPASISGLEALDGAHLSLSREAVESALWEILENAKKFHPRRSPQVEIFAARQDKELAIEILDDGVTVPPEQLMLVWVPYYQGEKHHSGCVAGMGLGLPFVASLVWSRGGRCRIYNRDKVPGIGVELVLPLAAR